MIPGQDAGYAMRGHWGRQRLCRLGPNGMDRHVNPASRRLAAAFLPMVPRPTDPTRIIAPHVAVGTIGGIRYDIRQKLMRGLSAPRMDMELCLLRSFVQMHGAGSISRAAVRLACTQAALSMRQKMLETKFGAALFLRRPQGGQPTPRRADLHAKAPGWLGQGLRCAGVPAFPALPPVPVYPLAAPDLRRSARALRVRPAALLQGMVAAR